MSSFNYEQRQAITLRNKTILVSAPAGSGKTRILVARIIDLIKNDGYSIKEFLVLTFTDAAGQEMKQRLQATLYDELKDDSLSPELKSHIEAQILALPYSLITTFDSYCKYLLTNYGYLVGVTPGFEVLSNNTLLLNETLDECLETFIQDKKFQDYISRYNKENHFDNFKEMFLSIRTKMSSFHNFEAFLQKIHQENYQFESIHETNFFQYLVSTFKRVIDDALFNYTNAYLYAQNNHIDSFFDTSEKNPESISEILFAYLSDLKLEINQCRSEDNFISILSREIGKLPRMSYSDLDPEVKDKMSKLKDNILKPIKNFKSDITIQSIKDLKSLLQLSYQDLYYLVGKDGLIDRFNQVFTLKKQALHVLDFQDLEYYATKLLDIEEIRATLHLAYKEIMVDEYQDTNQIQENLVLKIAEGKENIPMFMVGDMKQSIYRFRQADPSIFKYKFDTFTPLDEMTEKDTHIRIDLKYNYRSEKAVLDSINYIFEGLLDKEVGGLDYLNDPNAIFHYDYEAKGKSLESLISIRDYDSEILVGYHHKNKEYKKEELEAHMVAQKIQSLIASNQYQYEDICVLMRNSSHLMTYKKIFEQYQIPTHITLSKGLLSSNEILTLKALLKALINPYDDISLLSVLHAPFEISHFNENELIKIRKNEGKSLYENLINDTSDKVLDFLKDFEALRKLQFNHSSYEIILEALRITHYDLFASRLFNGDQRLANIDSLLELALKDENKHLKDFVYLLETGIELSPGKIASDEALGVEFMTIHKSKGLEFKVVFLSSCHNQFNTSDETSLIVLDKDTGISQKYSEYRDYPVAGSLLSTYTSIYHDVITSTIHKASIDEEMRILYVALTRAKEKFIITGMLNEEEDLNKLIENIYVNEHYDFNSPYKTSILHNTIRQTDNYLNWILSSTIRHPDVLETLKQIDNRNAYLSFSKKGYEAISKNETQLAHFHLNFYQDNEIIESIPKRINTNKIQLENQFVDKASSYTYPYEDKGRSIAVTTMQKLADEENRLFLDKSENVHENAAEFGTNVHLLMSYFDFKDDTNKLESLYQEKCFDDKAYLELKAYQSHIDTFIDSDIYKQIGEAKHIYKEKPFRYKDNNQIVNGIIDLVFELEDKVVVLDYKTDHVSNKNSDQVLVLRHQIQIEYYKKVLKTIFNKEVEGYLYYFEIDSLIKV